MKSSRSRKSHEQRLKELGITEVQSRHYKQMFCINRLRHKYLKMGRKGWVTCPYPWQDRLILRHLTHEEVIGLFPANRIDYLMIDVDNHDPKINPPVADRARGIIKLFDGRPLVYTSSNSGGLRVCYFLDKSYQKTTIHDFANRKLTHAGVKIHSGYIEILAQGKGDRLPFGQGSYLVDLHTFEPLCGVCLAAMIKCAWGLYNRERLHIGDPVPVRSAELRSGNEFNDIITRLIENGLPPDMTTNDAMMMLSWELICRRSFSRDEAARYLKSWIRSKHNCNSRRFNSGEIDNLDSHIDRIVRSCNPDRAQSKPLPFRKSVRRLTVGDVGRITEVFSNYRTQLAAFSLLEQVKSSGILRDCVDCSDALGLREDNRGNYSILGFLQSWECEIPYKRFIQLDGFDKTHPAKTRKLLEDSGLMEMYRKEDRSRHKCRTYLIFFTFDKKSDDVVSLDEALVRLKNPQELRRDYSRYRSNLLLKGVANCS